MPRRTNIPGAIWTFADGRTHCEGDDAALAAVFKKMVRALPAEDRRVISMALAALDIDDIQRRAAAEALKSPEPEWPKEGAAAAVAVATTDTCVGGCGPLVYRTSVRQLVCARCMTPRKLSEIADDKKSGSGAGGVISAEMV